jgi:2-phosphoglycerate kinase
MLLIAGTNGTGKSTLASKITSKCGSHVIKTSDVREALRTCIPREAIPELFFSTYRLTDMCVHTPLHELLERQALPILRCASSILDMHSGDPTSTILEGIHITPAILGLIEHRPLSVVVLKQPEPESHWEHLLQRSKINKRKQIAKYCDYFENIRSNGDYIESSWSKIKPQPDSLRIYICDVDSFDLTIL